MREGYVRLKAIVFLMALVPLGFYSKYYDGPAAEWVNNSLGGALYELFWCIVTLVIIPYVKPLSCALPVFAITCMLETLQLWQPPLLDSIRATFIGKTLLGNCFMVSDFLYYLIGSAGGYLLIPVIQRK